MMQANELRIGNLIEMSYFDAPDKWSREIVTSLNDLINGMGGEYIRPIPLTPEILEKAGFRNRIPDSDMVISVMNDKNIILNQNKSNNSYWFLYPALWHPTNHIKYVHQLQNLYFALTGEELTEIFLTEKMKEK